MMYMVSHPKISYHPDDLPDAALLSEDMTKEETYNHLNSPNFIVYTLVKLDKTDKSGCNVRWDKGQKKRTSLGVYAFINRKVSQ
jgi:CRISPR/Cas system CSM-associated protein Csm5 (group 7 of RAMP superfamily)